MQFNQIPLNWLVPGNYVEIDNSGAVQGTPPMRKPVLLVGMRTSAGEVAEKVVTPITAASQGALYFGRGSQLAHMIERFFAANQQAEVYAVALNEDATGVAASATITVTGTATEDGTIPLLVGGRPVSVAVLSGDNQDAVAAAIEAAIDADDELMVTAASVDEVVTVTARHKGASGNSLSIFSCYYPGEKLPGGISLAITSFASGTKDPDISDVIAILGDDLYYSIVTPWTADPNMDALEAELETRWGPMVAKPGHAFAAIRANYADSATYGESRNSQFSTVLPTSTSPTPPWECAAILAAVEVAENDPARPRQNVKLPGMLPPPVTARYSATERNLLLLAGLATFKVEAGDCFLERCVTTYTEKNGITDTSFRDIETMRTLAYLRYSLNLRFTLKFPNAKLADDGAQFGAGQLVVTPKIARAEILALVSEWEGAGLVENYAQFAKELVVVRDANDPNRLNAFLPPDLINQFRVGAFQIGFKL